MELLVHSCRCVFVDISFWDVLQLIFECISIAKFVESRYIHTYIHNGNYRGMEGGLRRVQSSGQCGCAKCRQINDGTAKQLSKQQYTAAKHTLPARGRRVDLRVDSILSFFLIILAMYFF